MTKDMATFCLLASVLATLLATGHSRQIQEKCGENEEWTTCGSLCPRTCVDVTNMRSKMCAQVCVKGCFCKTGYVLNGGRCVEEKTCPCGPHAHYMCGTTCPVTCDNYHNPPRACTKDCVFGCHCDKDYVRYGDSGKCVLPKECSYKG